MRKEIYVWFVNRSNKNRDRLNMSAYLIKIANKRNLATSKVSD